MDGLVLDLQYSLRMLRKSPLVTAAALFSLAIGIGANTAMFNWLDGLVLSPLRVQEPERLVHLYNTDLSGFRGSFSYLNYRDQRDRNEVFEGAGARSSLRVGCLGREHVPRRDFRHRSHRIPSRLHSRASRRSNRSGDGASLSVTPDRRKS